MNTIFTNQNTAHLVELFLWMLGAFLLGWLLSRIFSSKTEKIIEKEVIVEKVIIVEKEVIVEKIVFRDSEVRDIVRAVNAAIDMPESSSLNTLSEETQKTSGDADKASSSIKDLNFESFGKAVASEKDDLKRISGIGSSLEKKLNGIGIFTYQQISKFTTNDMTDITDLITFFPGRIERDNWVKQAINLVNGIETDFSKRVDKGDIY